jgi:hypothetical protein
MSDLGAEAMRLLVDDLSKDDVEVHVIAFRKLTTVAKALGPERSRNELVPFLRGESKQVEKLSLCRCTLHN